MTFWHIFFNVIIQHTLNQIYCFSFRTCSPIHADVRLWMWFEIRIPRTDRDLLASYQMYLRHQCDHHWHRYHNYRRTHFQVTIKMFSHHFFKAFINAFADKIAGPRDSRSLPIHNRLHSRSVSQDSVYTILIRLPPDGGSGDERAPSIKMIQDDVPLALTHPPRRPLPSRDSDLGDVKLNLDG